MLVVAADEDAAVAVAVVPGQAHDAPHLGRMLDAATARTGPVGQVVGDKGFDGGPQRRACRDRGAEPVIPARRNIREPGPLDRPAYRARNRAERLFAKLKQYRRVATRYDKRKSSYLCWLHLTLVFIRLRKTAVANRP